MQDLRDDDDDGEVESQPAFFTHINYDDREVLAPGADRQQRRPTRLSKRSLGSKLFEWTDDPVALEVTEELEWRTHRSATTVHEVDDRGRPVRVTDALGTATA